MSDWERNGKTLRRFHESGFWIIKQDSVIEISPMFCPVCDTVMKGSRDIESWEELECCHSCAMVWAEPRRKEWLLGWRPSADDKEIKR